MRLTRFSLILTSIASLAFVPDLSAQTLGYVGFRMGKLISSPSVPPADQNMSHHTSLCGGAIVGLRFSELIALDFELNYVRKGYDYLVFDQFPESKRAEYIELPILAKVSTSFDRLALFLRAGPSFASKISETYSPNPRVLHAAVVRDYYTHFDLSLTLGGGATCAIVGQ
jgi:hypothetical protein